MIGNNTRLYLSSQDSADYLTAKASLIKRLISDGIKRDHFTAEKITVGIDEDGTLALEFPTTKLVLRTSERMVYAGDDFFWEISFQSQPSTEVIPVLNLYLNKSGQFFTDINPTIIDIDEPLNHYYFIEQLLLSALNKKIISIELK